MPTTPAAAALLVLALAGASQVPQPSVPQAANVPANIPAAEWSAMARGRTLTYRINGALWALEHYDAASNGVTLQLYDGTCMQGTWDYSEPYYCFHWDGQGTSCFRHVRLGERILVIEAKDGADTPMTQDMTGVSDTPLDCGPAATS